MGPGWLYFVFFTYLFQQCFADSKLLVISLDGFRYDYYDEYSHMLPNFRFFATNGVHAVNGMKSTMATMTFPAHYTMATGLNEESHGLVANAFWDRESGEYFSKNSTNKKFYQGEPIWVTAKKNGHKTGVVIWIGNLVDWSPYNPDYNQLFNPNKLYEERIEKALTLLNSDTNFTMVYIDDPDSVQHSNGTFSKPLERMLIRLDNMLSPVVKNVTQGPLRDKLNVILLADHGMLNVTNLQRINMKNVMQKAYNASLMNSSAITRTQMDELFDNNYIWADSGVITHLYARSDRFHRVLQANLLRRLITSNDTSLINQAVYNTVNNVTIIDGVVEWNNLTFYLKSQLPARWHYSHHERIGDLVVVAKPGAMVDFFTHNETAYMHAANHGYDNDLRGMHALFIGYGPHFKKGYKITKPFPQNCIYSLMCDVLSVPPAANNGTIDPFKRAIVRGSNSTSSAMVSTIHIAPLLIALLLIFFS